MASLKLVISSAKGEYEKAFRAIQEPIAAAASGAIRDAADQIKRDGRSAIGAAGFSAKWQNAFQVRTYPSKPSMGAAAFAYHKIPYAGIFARGGKIEGSPYLWLPIGNLPGRVGGKRLTPRVYEQNIGPLHPVIRSGRPPLLAAYTRGKPGARPTLSRLRAGGALARLGVRQTKGVHGTAGVVSVPVFVGIKSVNLKKRFDLDPVYERARAGLTAGYFRNLKANG